MTNLDKLKEKINKLSAKEMARYINDFYLDDAEACKVCAYDEYKCIEDCEFGIEAYLKMEVEE